MGRDHMTERDDSSFEILLADAERGFEGWDFSHIRDRMVTAPLPWSYTSLILPHLRRAGSMVDLGTGGGEFLTSLQPLPADTCATEGYPPNVPVARAKLEPLGVEVAEVGEDGMLPYTDSRFDLVINRHEFYLPSEVSRVLKPGGRFITQQVGDQNDLELNRLLGAPPSEELTWHFEDEVRALSDAGFTIEKQQEAFPITRIYDVGAIVYHLNAIPWEVPGFTVEEYRDRLLDLHHHITEQGYLDITSHRSVIVARKPE